MMEYILVVILLIIGLMIWGYISKKKYFKEIDRLETWKMNIMDRPILEELSKVKQLNMTGETEEMFERWRSEWDAIITIHMPDVEELLFDAEDYVDKFRFSRSKEVQRNIAVKLTEVENSIEHILEELNELVGSEEKNRLEIEEIKESYRNSKKELLAHRHTYGTAATHLEIMIDEVLGILQQYELATKNGNYLKARELVLSVKSQLSSIQLKMELIPHLLIESQSSLPTMISELKGGYQEMLEQGYTLNHIDFEKEILRFEKELEQSSEQLYLAQTDEPEKRIKEITESVNDLYDLLEAEVYSKQYIQQNEQVVKEELEILEYEHEKLKAETTVVRHSYHVNESELEAQRILEKQISQLVKRFMSLTTKMTENSVSSSALNDEMKDIEEQLNELKEEQNVFLNKLQDLRKDEFEAREAVKELRKKLASTSRIITKSNAPGLPEEYKNDLYEAKECITDVQNKLEQKPLDMASVQVFLEKAVESVTKLSENTSRVIEQMYLAEKVIQYGNRFRSRYPRIAEELKNAEQHFRNYEYDTALEIAASAIEKVEPGSLEKIQADTEKILL